MGRSQQIILGSNPGHQECESTNDNMAKESDPAQSPYCALYPPQMFRSAVLSVAQKV